jgi:electron transport complex protein RnfB
VASRHRADRRNSGLGTRDSGPVGLANHIDAILPQTQCRRCGYPSCRAYAEALAEGSTSLNRCPPGGSHTITALAKLLSRESLTLDAACGEEREWVVARIDEAACIGCTLCIQSCPVDAILGATKHMHTVIESECTGCELCLEPCPVDCIYLQPMQWQGEPGARRGFLESWLRRRAPLARRRFEHRSRRLERARSERLERRRSRRSGRIRRDAERAAKQTVIRAAVRRARARRRVPTGR